MGSVCSNGFVCGDLEDEACRGCSFTECQDKAIASNSVGFSYAGTSVPGKGYCRLCDEANLSFAESSIYAWGTYSKTTDLPCTDAWDTCNAATHCAALSFQCPVTCGACGCPRPAQGRFGYNEIFCNKWKGLCDVECDVKYGCQKECGTCSEDVCTFVTGDITDKSEDEVGETKDGFKNIAQTAQECAKWVRHIKRDATGATWQPSNKRCWAEYGTNIDSSATSYVTCKFEGCIKYNKYPHQDECWTCVKGKCGKCEQKGK